MTDTARLILTAAVLSGSALGAFSIRLRRTDPQTPDRLIGELRLAQWSALLLAAIGAINVGLAISGESRAGVQFDAALGIAFVTMAGIILHREPREALILAAGAFLLHALTDIAHRPGWLAADLAPRWYILGSAIYDVCIAAIIYLARRNKP